MVRHLSPDPLSSAPAHGGTNDTILQSLVTENFQATGCAQFNVAHPDTAQPGIASRVVSHTASITAALMLVTALAIGWGMASVLDDAPAYVSAEVGR